MAMDVKGITWVGNIYQKFENMCLEVEDTMFEEAVKYVDNQMQIVGESVKRIYSDVMQDLLPPSSCDDEMATSELPIDQYTDAEKSFQGSKKINNKADAKQTSEDSRINHDVNNDVTHAESGDTDVLFMSDSGNSDFTSNARQYIERTDTKQNLDRDENQQNTKMPAFKEVDQITLSETDACSTSESCELYNINQNHADTVSKSSSVKITNLSSIGDSCNEIENASSEEITAVMALVKLAEEKEMNMSSSSVGDPYGFSMVQPTQPDDYSYNTIIVSHSETLQQNDELKLEETCVMVTIDALQLVPKAGCHLNTSKSKRRQPFCLSKKSARKQEYEELAVWHGNNENRNDECAENLCPTLQENHKKLQVADISEPEWELL